MLNSVYNRLNDSNRGYLLAFLAVFFMAPDSLLLRMIDGPVWTIAMYRGWIAGIATLLIIHHRRGRQAWFELASTGSIGWLAALCPAIGSIAFVYAITHLNVTMVLVIIAFSPLIACCISAIWLGRSAPTRTWIALVLCAIGISGALSQSWQLGNIWGPISAFIAATMMALHLTIMDNFKDRDLSLTMGLGNILSGFIALPFITDFTLSSSNAALLALDAIVIVPLSFILLSFAPRFISAAEVSLVLLLESILASIWVWFVLSETPSQSTVIAGSIVLLTLMFNSLLTLREQRINNALANV